MLALGRSHRVGHEREVIGQGGEGASIVGEWEPQQSGSVVMSPLKVAMQFRVEPTASGQPRMKTVVKVNDAVLKRRSQMVGLVRCVRFFYTDLALLRGAPAERRAWLDGVLAQWEGEAGVAALVQFQSVRKQKAALLSKIAEQGLPVASVREQVAVWNEAFARAAAAVTVRRMLCVASLAPNAMAHYEMLASVDPTVSLAVTEQFQLTYVPYVSSALSPDVFSRLREVQAAMVAAVAQHPGTLWECLPGWEDTIAKVYGQVLEHIMPAECARGQCLVGPHRDDVGFVLLPAANERGLSFSGGQDATVYASQGQQRSMVLALKLAELQLLAVDGQSWPLLLMDDVMAELDPQRQAHLLGQIPAGVQMFLTTTHLENTLTPLMRDFLAQGEAQVVEVNRGAVQISALDWALPALSS